MTKVDESRFGHYGWVTETKGKLLPSDYIRMAGPGLSLALRNAVGLLRLRFGLTPASVREVGPEDLQPPTSHLAELAVQAWSDQSPEIKGHSCRTWMFGIALALVDGCGSIDREALYCTALVHDYGLDRGPTQDVDFTLMGADQVSKFASRDPRGAEIASLMMDAICVHPTLGISSARDGALGYYLQAGSMADVGGLRRWAVGRAVSEEIFKRQPSGPNFKARIVELIRNESEAVPRGRFAFYRRCGMTIGARIAPDHV